MGSLGAFFGVAAGTLAFLPVGLAAIVVGLASPKLGYAVAMAGALTLMVWIAGGNVGGGLALASQGCAVFAAVFAAYGIKRLSAYLSVQLRARKGSGL